MKRGWTLLAPATRVDTCCGTISEVKMSNSAAGIFRRVNDAVYWTGAGIACVALVLVSAVIPWAVYTRYILNSASSWPEPMAVLLTVGITFIGSANCYRQRIHMNMTVGTDLLPPLLRRGALFLSEVLMGVIAIFMVIWGMRLVQTTWGNSVDEFPWLSVGVTYLPIVVSGAMMLLFVVERLTIGPPPRDGADAHVPVE
jgi:TRAP-type C4-dicarboxylate transport system permease small subunit